MTGQRNKIIPQLITLFLLTGLLIGLLPPGAVPASAAPLTADGDLDWHTFLGGSGSDISYNIASDSSGNIYVAGESSADWAETPIRAYAKGKDDSPEITRYFQPTF